MKKITLFILIILLLISLYKDLTMGTILSPTADGPKEVQMDKGKYSFEIVKVKINPGDTVISVIEQLNPKIDTRNLDHILEDFKKINPNTVPEQLQLNNYYFFPKYYN